MTCPRCSVAEISGSTGACELCGYVPDGAVAVGAPHPDATDEIARAQLAHQFRIDVLLGQGDRSAVYLAHEADSSRHIVLKVLPRVAGRPDTDLRFRDAITAVMALDHPHLVPVLRHGETDSLLWYSMEHRRARPLREVLRAGRLDYRGCMRLVTQIAAGLDYLHRRGATHGRLKPENVLVDSEQWVYVCDAIVARALHPQAAAAPATAYTAPEDVLGGFVGPASDQFALAALIHECLAGSPPGLPVPGAPAPPTLSELRPDLPVHVAHAVARALSRRPNDRYPGILDFVTALESGSSLMVDARPSGRASELILTIPGWEPPRQDRPKWIIPSAVAGGVVAIAAVVVLLTQRSHAPPIWRNLPAVSSAHPAISAADSARGTAPPPVTGLTPQGTISEQLRRQTPTEGPRVVDLRADREPRGSRRTSTPQAAPAVTTPPTRSETRVSTPSPAPAPAAAPPPAPAPASAPAGDPGRLFVNASPWGQLFVDGQLIGNTPKANLSVTPGTHTIRVAREGFDPIERTIRVGAGETVRLTDLVLTPRP